MQRYEIAILVVGFIMLFIMVKLAVNHAKTLGGGKK